jgi:hypothetical protein
MRKKTLKKAWDRIFCKYMRQNKAKEGEGSWITGQIKLKNVLRNI